ncbi:forkhead box protein D5-C-like [Haliotis cracherodii]|uniref:forkhead box protein D5-C-like n=1 Tax=Haliotis cracherodii TaxID=6455 RepID=UPI0039ECBAB8
MINFSIDFITGQNTTGRKEDNSFSEEEGSVPSPLSSDDGGAHCSSSPLDKDTTVGPTVRDRRPGVKPTHSYIALISMAILSTEGKKMLLSDIYSYIMDNFPYYNNKDKAWRNSIRHNLSLNECFVKSGRADNGKGNYWSIHPACIDDFSRGDFRRRQARRRARKNSLSRDTCVSNLPLSYRYNLGYVPMTPSTVGTPTYRPCYSPPSPVYATQTSFYCPPVSTGVTQGLYAPYQSQPSVYSSPAPTPGLAVSSSWGCDLYRSKDFTHTPVPYTE